MSADRVLLLRHGRTEYNAQQRFQGQIDIPLDDVGLRQAVRAADALAPLLTGQAVTIVSSDLQRAARTAEVLGSRIGAPVRLDARLREIFAGEWEGLFDKEIAERRDLGYDAWRRGDPDVLVGGGESRRSAGARAAAAIVDADAALDGGTLVCVSHGTALRGAVLQLLATAGLPATAAAVETPGLPWDCLQSLDNAHWAQLRRTARGWRLSSYNVCCATDDF